MYFASDNSGPAHPSILAALQAANEGYTASYGADDLTLQVQQQIRDLFEAPEAAVYLVGVGTAANALGLACLTQPWQTIYCANAAHIDVDECGAPEFFAGGAKLSLIDSPDGKLTPQSLGTALEATAQGVVHGVQRGPIALSQATEWGTIYTLPELQALAEIARTQGLPMHMDGARFANALVRLGCSPAEMSWKSGVDILSFGASKNGCLGVEAVAIFDPAKAWEFELRRKRAGHLFSKHRYLAAQMSAYLQDGLWRDLAGAANAASDRLAAGLQARPEVELLHPPQANMIFARWPRDLHQRLFDAGAVYHIWQGKLEGDDPTEQLTARLVCDWSATSANTDQFLALFNR